MFVSVWRHLPMHEISNAVSPCGGCWRLSFCMSNLRTCWPGNIFSSLFWLFERRFAQNLAFGGNQALRIPLKVIWVTPKSPKGQMEYHRMNSSCTVTRPSYTYSIVLKENSSRVETLLILMERFKSYATRSWVFSSSNRMLRRPQVVEEGLRRHQSEHSEAERRSTRIFTYLSI